MTLKSLMNFGNLAKDRYYSPIDRYHSGSSGYHHSGSGGYQHSGTGGYHYSSRGGHKSKGGSGAALSALTLLAFLFLINVMQQSLQDNNSTAPMTPTTAVMLRNDEQPLTIVLDDKEEKEQEKEKEKEKEKESNKREEAKRGTLAKSKIQRLNNQYIK